jgi:hypothetical protein
LAVPDQEESKLSAKHFSCANRCMQRRSRITEQVSQGLETQQGTGFSRAVQARSTPASASAAFFFFFKNVDQ